MGPDQGGYPGLYTTWVPQGHAHRPYGPSDPTIDRWTGSSRSMYLPSAVEMCTFGSPSVYSWVHLRDMTFHAQKHES